MSAIRRAITAGTLVAPLVLFLAGTAAATDRSEQGYPPIHPLGVDDEFGDSGSYAGEEGAGTFWTDAGTDEDDTWYYADGTYAGPQGAGTYDMGAWTDNYDEAGYYSGGTHAGIDGAGTFGVDAGANEDETFYFADGSYAGEDGAGTYDQGAWTDNYDEAGYFSHGTHAGIDGAWSSDSDANSSDYDAAETSLVKEPATETATPIAAHGCDCDDHGLATRPTHFAAEVDDWAAYHHMSAASGPHGAATHAAAGFGADGFFVHHTQGAAAGPDGAAYHDSGLVFDDDDDDDDDWNDDDDDDDDDDVVIVDDEDDEDDD